MKNIVLMTVSCLLFLSLLSQEKNINIPETEKKLDEKKLTLKNFSSASTNFTVHYYRCEWEIDPAEYQITGTVTSYFTITQSTDNITFDFTTALSVDSILSHHQHLNFIQNNDALNISFPSSYNANDNDSVSIFYHGAPPANNQAFVQSTHNNVPVIWTLSEPYGAKDWWPCRNGLDDKADSIDIFITHPSQYKASSNGVLIDEEVQDANTITHYKHRYPIASYLVAVAVTNYSVFTKLVVLDNIMLPLRSYVYPEDSLAFANTSSNVIQALQLFSKYFGTYPFVKERYGQTQFGYRGGMEHQTNSFVFSAEEHLNVHELAHQWFGDKITCASWQDIWLNEGFATYLADFFYNENMHPEILQSYVASDLVNIVSSPDGSVFINDTTNINRIFDGRLTYNKGAFLLRMLRFTLGDSVFFKGLQDYQNDSLLKYNFASTKDLQRNLEQASGKDLNYFFQQWFYGEGYPSFHIKWSENLNNKVQLNIHQTASHPSVSFYKVSLPVTFKNTTQQKTIILQNDYNDQSFNFDLGFNADTVLIDPEMYLISNNNTSEKLPSSTISNDIRVYPNPFEDAINVSVFNPSSTSLQMQLLSSTGQRLWNNTFDLSGNDISFNIPAKQLARGIYFLKIETNDGVKITKKLVK